MRINISALKKLRFFHLSLTDLIYVHAFTPLITSPPPHHRGELEASEYAEQRKETVDQLQELNATLKKVAANNMSLVDDLGSMQLVRGVIWCCVLMNTRVSVIVIHFLYTRI